MDDFVTVFDISESGFRSIGFASTGFLFIAIGLVMFFWPKIALKLNLQKTKKETKLQKFFRFFFLGFALFWTTTALFSTYGEFASLRDATCKTVEGRVENFDPMPYGGHKTESYSVQNVRFSYSEYIVTNGFNNTASHGGPVNKNSVVRICYVPKGGSNVITKLEVKGYKGSKKDYFGGFDFISQFKQLDEDRKSGKFNKQVKGQEKALIVAGKYMAFIIPMFIADSVLYILFLIPFFSFFFKIKTIEHRPLEIDKKILNQEKHILENLTVKYDGEGVLWARPYGIEVFNSPGCAMKMYLSPDKTQVVKSELRMSTLMYISIFLMAFMAIEFFGTAMGDIFKTQEGMKFFPYVMFPMIAINFWIVKGRFEKKINQLLGKDE